MIVDTSALLALLYQEANAGYFAEAMALSDSLHMSAANFLEAATNVDRDGEAEASRQLDYFMRRAQIQVATVTLDQAQIARQVYLSFGKGRHRANLDFGDCFANALAVERQEPLLFTGNDFGHTDVLCYNPLD